MKFLATVVSFLAATQAFAETRSINLNEVPEAITKNLSTACSAQALSQATLVLEVKSRSVDSVYAIPCRTTSKVLEYTVYVMSAKGKYDYLSFGRVNNVGNYYIPRPSLEESNGEVTISFSSPTRDCKVNESGSYKLVDNSNILWTSFSAERISHSCNN